MDNATFSFRLWLRRLSTGLFSFGIYKRQTSFEVSLPGMLVLLVLAFILILVCIVILVLSLFGFSILNAALAM